MKRVLKGAPLSAVASAVAGLLKCIEGGALTSQNKYTCLLRLHARRYSTKVVEEAMLALLPPECQLTPRQRMCTPDVHNRALRLGR